MTRDNLYNVDLKTGDCVEHRPVDHDVPIEQFLMQVRAATEGLTDCSIEIDSEPDYDVTIYTIVVSGRRKLTEAERNRIQAERDRAAKYQAHMKAFRG